MNKKIILLPIMLIAMATALAAQNPVIIKFKKNTYGTAIEGSRPARYRLFVRKGQRITASVVSLNGLPVRMTLLADDGGGEITEEPADENNSWTGVSWFRGYYDFVITPDTGAEYKFSIKIK